MKRASVKSVSQIEQKRKEKQQMYVLARSRVGMRVDDGEQLK